MATLRTLGDGLLDLLFPPRCDVCAAYGAFFCAACRARSEPAALITAPSALVAICAVGSHSGPLREAVLHLKFGARLALVEPLGQLLAEIITERRDEWRPEAVVPVPIHWTRRLRRGFNQSELLAVAAGRRLGLETRPVLRRTRRTPPQVGRTATERLANVRGAFQLATPGAGRRVVLVDDVCTTGATLAECAAALRAGGVESVYAVTVTSEPIGGTYR